MEQTKWTENVILADADYVDAVAFNLTVNFERMLGRRIPQADMAQWAECVALDGGLTEGDHEVQIILVHDRQTDGMKNFNPGKYEELNGKAFQGRMGEFTFTAVQTEEMAGKADLLGDMLQVVGYQEGVKRLMLIVADHQLDGLRPLLKSIDRDNRRTTVFTMQPIQGGAFRHEMLGYSLMAALGISGKEIDEKLNR